MAGSRKPVYGGLAAGGCWVGGEDKARDEVKIRKFVGAKSMSKKEMC